MSTIIADNLTGKTAAGNVTVTSEGGAATFQLQQGLAKAWVNFNGTGTIAARDSFNLSSLTDNGTGDHTANFSSSMSNANFMFSSTTSGDDNNYGYTFPKGPVTNEFVYATSSIRSSSGFASDTSSSASVVDVHQFNISVHGDLA